MHRTFFPLFVAVLAGCAQHHQCDAPEPDTGTANYYSWQATIAAPCGSYHGTVEPLEGLMPGGCHPLDWCGDSGTFACPVPTGTLVYDVAVWWDDDELHGDGAVTRYDTDGVETCSGDVAILARPAVF
jgi:hypothetical protein